MAVLYSLPFAAKFIDGQCKRASCANDFIRQQRNRAADELPGGTAAKVSFAKYGAAWLYLAPAFGGLNWFFLEREFTKAVARCALYVVSSCQLFFLQRLPAPFTRSVWGA